MCNRYLGVDCMAKTFVYLVCIFCSHSHILSLSLFLSPSLHLSRSSRSPSICRFWWQLYISHWARLCVCVVCARFPNMEQKLSLCELYNWSNVIEMSNQRCRRIQSVNRFALYSVNVTLAAWRCVTCDFYYEFLTDGALNAAWTVYVLWRLNR